MVKGFFPIVTVYSAYWHGDCEKKAVGHLKKGQTMMEHRLDNRIQVPINVVIHINKRGTFKTRANNLSRGGVNVEMDTAWGIREKTLVSIEFMDEWLSAKIPALVLKTTLTSVSLMFIEPSNDLLSFLNYLNI